MTKIFCLITLILCSCEKKIKPLHYIDGIYKGISKTEPMAYVRDSVQHYTSSTGISIIRLDNGKAESFSLNFDQEQIVDYFNEKIAASTKEKLKLRLYLSTINHIIVVDSLKLLSDTTNNLFDKVVIPKDSSSFKPYSDVIRAYYLKTEYTDNDSIIVYSYEGDPYKYKMPLALKENKNKEYFLKNVRYNFNSYIDIYYTQYAFNKDRVDSVKLHH